MPTNSPRPADKVPTGADTSFAQHLLEENRFLRGVIEQLQRDGAETRNALRKALEIAPRQLVQGADESARNAPEHAQNGEANKVPATMQNAPKSAPMTYADIINQIEAEMMNQ